MAKSSKIKLLYGDDSSILESSPSFQYEIEVFVIDRNGFRLEDVITKPRKDMVKDLTEYEKLNDCIRIKYFKMVGAPIKWLKENNFKEYDATNNV